MNNFEVTIESFAGPLDLMIHLIKTNKLDLFDLDMNVLTTQYINYITTLQHQNVEIASEFLSELASLIEYKSKKLLPREKVEVEEVYEEDEREKLVARLIEYQNYKEVATILEQSYQQRQTLHSKAISEETQQWINESSEIIQGSPYELMKAMQRVLKRQSLHQVPVGILNVKEVSLEERSAYLDQFIKIHRFTTFSAMCQDCVNLHMVVVSFLVLLDFIKNKIVSVEIIDDEINVQRIEYNENK